MPRRRYPTISKGRDGWFHAWVTVLAAAHRRRNSARWSVGFAVGTRQGRRCFSPRESTYG